MGQSLSAAIDGMGRAVAWQSIGAVVFFGVTSSMVLTLIVVPTVYNLIARNTHSPQYVAQLIDKLSGKTEGPAAERA